jgi:hypothetical protein
MKLNIFTLAIMTFATTTISFGQVVLNADKNKNTYEVINSALAPKHNAIEVPDESHLILCHISQQFTTLI